MKTAKLYTRVGCHLCDETARVLEAQGLTPIEIDIDQHPDLVAKYSTQVPVVEINGKVRFRGGINPLLLSRIVVAEFTDCEG